MAALLLLRYGELALKSPPVRRQFEQTLRHNVLEQFVAAGIPCRLRADRGHLYLSADEAEPALRLVRRVFGVTSVSPVVEVESDPAKIRDRLLEMADPVLTAGSTFAIRARRTGTHPFTSQELARDLGSVVLDRFAERQLRVNLDAPSVELFVEVRGPRTYLYTDRRLGPGGLPLGVAGRVVALVDGPRGALGAYLMMKRGCRCSAVVRAPSGLSGGEVLRRFDPKLETIDSTSPDDEETRLRTFAERPGVDGVVLPLLVEEYPEARSRWGDRVVFSPTVGLNEEEVSERWKRVEELAA